LGVITEYTRGTASLFQGGISTEEQALRRIGIRNRINRIFGSDIFFKGRFLETTKVIFLIDDCMLKSDRFVKTEF
jgi:hypothetical protein